MKINIVVPASPFLTDDRAFMPLGPIQVATAAREIAKWDVEIIDLSGPGCPGWLSQPADVWGVFIKTCHFYQAQDILAMIRAMYPESYVIAGGPHANVCGQELIDYGFDAVVAAQSGGGGGESGLLKILREVESGNKLSGIISLSPGDPSQYPWPDRSLVDTATYRYYIGGERAAHVVTQYGCPYSCSFCCHWHGYRRVIHRNYDHILGELLDLQQFGYRAVMNFSDELNIYESHLIDWCEAVRATKMIWRAFVHTGKLTEADMEIMAASGCIALGAGVESGSVQVLKKIRKGTTPEKNLRWIEWCIKYKIAPKAFMIVGLPGETHDTIEESRLWLKKAIDAGLSDFDMTIFTPLPGSPVAANPAAYGVRVLDPRQGVYKGRPGEYQAAIAVGDLSAADLVAAREGLDAEFRGLVRDRAVAGDAASRGR